MASSRLLADPSEDESSDAPALISDPDWEDEEDDDDDMDFETALEEGFEDDDDDVVAALADSSEAQEDDSTSNGGEDEDEEDTETEANNGATNSMTITLEQLQNILPRQQLMALFNRADIRTLFAQHGNNLRVEISGEDDDETDGFSLRTRMRRRKPSQEFKWPPVPHPEGQKLIEAGVFGTNEPQLNPIRRKKKLAYRTMMRELGSQSPGGEQGRGRLMRQDMIPSKQADVTIGFPARGYCGQFSEDGNFFFTGSQDFCVRLYDTSNPFQWKFFKSSPHYGAQWTISDVAMSPDSRHVVSSTLGPQACLTTTDQSDGSDPQVLDIFNMGNGRRRQGRGWHGGGVMSLRFSGDGREIVAGTNVSSIYVFDLEVGHSVLCIPGHEDDVNAVCYGDRSSPHILFSGSDDTTIKVWDRRSLGDGREAGAFLGHTEGITYVDSKGDGRYVISNSKDQTMKLWDLRKMIPPERAEKVNLNSYSAGFDYRYPPYPESERRANPHDCSLVTFRGHSVTRTLIRCHFSPAGSTDGRYVYSGSTDGCVWIWNLDGSVKAKIPSGYENGVAPPPARMYSESKILRDVSWHPNAPIIATTSWSNGAHDAGATTVHSWNDDVDDDEAEPSMGYRVDCEMRSAAERAQSRRTTRFGRGTRARVNLDDMDEDE